MIFADVGIPLIGLVVVLGWRVFVPVVILETAIARVLLRWRLRDAFRWVVLANGVSTLVGIPLAWFVSYFLSMPAGGGSWGDGTVVGVLRSPAWLGPGYLNDIGWAVPLALIVLLVPCFFVSWWIEFAVLRRVVPESARGAGRSLWAYAWKANSPAGTCVRPGLRLGCAHAVGNRYTFHGRGRK